MTDGTDNWMEILRNIEFDGRFEYGAEPTLEQFKETQVISILQPRKHI